jgi:hypothetical protein
MTTAAQVKKLVRPLLERHSDLVLVGRWIFVKPVGHFARGILIDRMLDAARFRPQWAVTHLFEASRFFPLNWGEWLDNEAAAKPGFWHVSDPELGQSLIREVERHALPPLRAMESLQDFLAFVAQHYNRHQLFDWPARRIIVEVALGDLDSARATAEAHRHIWSAIGPHHDAETQQQYRRLCDLCACLRVNNRDGLATLLHDWEALTVQNLKIRHLWEPTPFPLEVASARLSEMIARP